MQRYEFLAQMARICMSGKAYSFGLSADVVLMPFSY
jgi:hypothetical protein